jgi:hypothetical protein
MPCLRVVYCVDVGDRKGCRAHRIVPSIFRRCCVAVAAQWASEEINKRPDEYWTRVMDIATKFNLKRIIRCGTIMGRSVSVAVRKSFHVGGWPVAVS